MEKKSQLERQLENCSIQLEQLLRRHEEFEKEFLPASMTAAIPNENRGTAPVPAATVPKATVVMDPVKGNEQQDEVKKEDLSKTLVNIKFSKSIDGILFVTPIKTTLFCICDTISSPCLLLLAIAVNSLSSLFIFIKVPAVTVEPALAVFKAENPVLVRSFI
mgnify:CR=1 FL=1